MLFAPLAAIATLLVGQTVASPIGEVINSLLNPEICEFSFGTGSGFFSTNVLNRIVTFGDSSTDSGRGYAEFGKLGPPDFYYNHTWSNGPVYPVLLADRINLPLLGLAVAGSTTNNTRAPGTLEGVPVPSVQDQIDAFLASPAGAKALLPKSLIIIWSGQNNINSNPAATGADAASDIIYSINKLIKAGSQHILVMDAIDLGVSSPYVLGQPSLGPYLTAWATSFRTALFKQYPQTGSAATENPLVGVVDTFAVGKVLLASYEQFGLDPAHMGQPCVVGTTVCAAPDTLMFWDNLHPTRRTHSLIAAAAVAVMKAKSWVN